MVFGSRKFTLPSIGLCCAQQRLRSSNKKRSSENINWLWFLPLLVFFFCSMRSSRGQSVCSHYSNSCVHGADMNTMKKIRQGNSKFAHAYCYKGKNCFRFDLQAHSTTYYYTPHDIIRAWCQKSSKVVCGCCWMSPHHCSKKQQCRQLKRGFAVYGFSPDRNWLHFFPLFFAENNHEIWAPMEKIGIQSTPHIVQRITKKF